MTDNVKETKNNKKTVFCMFHKKRRKIVYDYISNRKQEIQQTEERLRNAG